MQNVAVPALLIAVGILLSLLLLRPPGWLVLALILLAFVPGRWWRWRTRRFRRGLRWMRRGRVDEAAEEFRAFLRDVESSPRFERVQPYFNLGRRYPYPSAARANVGVAELKSGRPAEALREFRTALESEPRWVPALYGAALALRALGRAAEAEAHARRALTARPSFLPAGLTLAALLREQGREEEARAVLDAHARKGRDPEALLQRLEREWGPKTGGPEPTRR